MRQWCHREQWRPSQIQAAIAKAMEDEPDGPDRDYWTTATSRDELKRKYGLKTFKPKPVTVTLVRECCGKSFIHVLKSRESAKHLTDYKCRDLECRKRHSDHAVRQVRIPDSRPDLRERPLVSCLVP